MSFGNGGYNPVPGGIGNIWSSSVPSGTYGVITPMFGSLGNSNTTPQISGITITKGNGYVTSQNSQTGRSVTVSSNGMRSNG